MPIDFDYDGLDVDLRELDELEDYISEGDVDTDRVFELEEGAEKDLSHNYDCVVVIDKVPKVPEEKLEKLTGVLRKLTGKVGQVQEDGLYLPVNDEGKTQGFCFVAFEEPPMAQNAIKTLNGFKFDKAHTFEVFSYRDLQRYGEWPEEYKEPERKEFEPSQNLRSWLLHPALRDQYVLRHGPNTEIYWCEGMVMKAQGTIAYDGERERQNGKTWCEMYTAWSPKGSYLATFHLQGIALWGGEKFEKLRRFAHKEVQHIEFSPNEKFLVTWNGKDDGRDPRSLIVWDIATGREMRAFKVNKQPNGDHAEWPVMKWSPDDKYFARQIVNGISVFDSSTMALAGGKVLKAKGIQRFEWSKSDALIAYWAPEVDNLPARVVLVDPATRTEVRAKNLFNVREVKLHWQDSGDFLCAQVLRHTKSGKTTYTNFEVFRMRDPNIPNEMLEIKDAVEHFSWEPSRARFGVIHGNNQHRLSVSFYTMGKVVNGDKLEKLYSIEGKSVSSLIWSPAGNAVVLAGKGINCEFEFWDVDENVCTAEVAHFMCNEMLWDPSGRMFATVVTLPIFGNVAALSASESGFNIWNFQGELLTKSRIENFYQFAWRPRPKSLLTKDEENKVQRSIKSYMARYSKEDEVRKKRLEAAANKEKIETLSEFRDLVARRKESAAQQNAMRKELGLLVEEEDVGYTIVEEEEEIVISERVEPFF